MGAFIFCAYWCIDKWRVFQNSQFCSLRVGVAPEQTLRSYSNSCCTVFSMPQCELGKSLILSQEVFVVKQTKNYFRDLYEVCVVLNSSLEPQLLLHKIAERLTATMEAKACSMRLLDRSGEVLQSSVSYGLSKGYLHKGSVAVKKSQIDEEVLSGGKPVYIEDVSLDRRFQYPEAAKAEGLSSVLVAPLKLEGRAIGVVRVYTAEKRTFSDEEREFLMAVTHLAAIAIENARLHAALKADFELQNAYSYLVFED